MNAEKYIELQFALKEAQEQVEIIQRCIDQFRKDIPDCDPWEPASLIAEQDSWKKKVKAAQDALTYVQQPLF